MRRSPVALIVIVAGRPVAGSDMAGHMDDKYLPNAATSTTIDAEFERDIIREHNQAGLKAARPTDLHLNGTSYHAH
jgi:hypothetical protein